MLRITLPENPAFFVLVTEGERDRKNGRITVRPGKPLPGKEPLAFIFNHSDRNVVRQVGELLVEAATTTYEDAQPPWVEKVPYIPIITPRHLTLRQIAHHAIDTMSEEEVGRLALPVWATLGVG